MGLLNKLYKRLKYYTEDILFAKRFICVPWKKRIVLLQVPEHTNIGDSALVIAEKKLIYDYFKHTLLYVEVTTGEYYRFKKVIKAIINHKDVIAIHAGGNMGNVWQEGEDCRRDIIKTFTNNKVISLPQTMYYEKTLTGNDSLNNSIEIYSAHKNLVLIAREKYSYDLMRNTYINNKILLTPDIALYINDNFEEMNREGVLLCLRSDKEKNLSKKDVDLIVEAVADKEYSYTDMYSKEHPNKTNRERIVLEKILEFKQSELIITDRLHGMILAVISGTPCVVLPNNHHKIVGVYEWIKDIKYVEFIDEVNEISEAIKKVLTVKESKYSNERFETYFKQIIKEVKEV